MRVFDHLGKKKVVIGLVHLKPLPGTPYYEEGFLEQALDKALRDSRALYTGGADGCLIQTVERTYPVDDEVDYARLSAMAKIVHEVSQASPPEFQIGVQIMANALKASLAVAKVCGGSFIRCMALVGETETAWGLVQAAPHDFLQYRSRIQARDIKLIAEVDGMHFRWKGGKPTAEAANMAYRMGADAVEVAHQDEETNARMVHDIKTANPNIAVILGGHTNHENVLRRMAEADGAFVGSASKKGAGVCGCRASQRVCSTCIPTNEIGLGGYVIMEPMHPSIIIDNQVKDLGNVTREQTPRFSEIIHNLLTEDELKSIHNVYTTGDGDSFHAALATEMAFKSIAKVNCEPLSAMRFLEYGADYMPAVFLNDTLVVGISASGSTLRVAQALERAKQAHPNIITAVISGDVEGRIGQKAERKISSRCLINDLLAPYLPGEPDGTPPAGNPVSW
jgi:membrane complex biogenesis BtpA family protein